MLNSLAARLFRAVNSPTVAATAASWSINTLAGHLRELEAAKAELEAAKAELEQQNADLLDLNLVLVESIADRRREAAELDAADATSASEPQS
jgi:hypothetical protein